MFDINKDFFEKSLTKDDIFSYILKYLFTFRANIFDDNNKLKNIYDHDPAFWLSINILYYIYNNYDDDIEQNIFIFEELPTNPIEKENYNISNKKENDKKLTNKKRNFKKNIIIAKRRRIILKPIKEKMDKVNIKSETVEKGIFREFRNSLKDDKKKDFPEELKNDNNYNSDLMELLFEKPNICELYVEFKNKNKNGEIFLNKARKNNNNKDVYLEIYKFYLQNFDLIFNK